MHFSEVSQEMANEANMSLFRDILEKIDYNEAVLLAGLNFLYQ